LWRRILNSFFPLYKAANAEVWCCDLDCAQTAVDLTTISADENLRANRFFQDIHRRRYIAAHVALRRVLSLSTGQPASALNFLSGHSGKPFLESVPGCHFNISHSDGVALIAVSSQWEVGVDIECVSDLKDLRELAIHHFSKDELQAWSALPEDLQNDAFYKVWVRKEACVKATGWGLNMSLPSFNVGFEPTQKVVTIDCPDGSSANVEVHSLSTGRGSYGAVAWWHT